LSTTNNPSFPSSSDSSPSDSDFSNESFSESDLSDSDFELFSDSPPDSASFKTSADKKAVDFCNHFFFINF